MSRTLYVYQDQLFEVIHEYTYSGNPEMFDLQPGTYLMMCYGARGGHKLDADNSWKPHGGFAMGILELPTTTRMYAVVGGDGENTKSTYSEHAAGGYNGGGRGGLANTTSYAGGPGGGGATDIRLNIDPDEYVSHTVTLGQEYEALEYLSGVRNSFIDTGYHVNCMTTVEIEFFADSSTSRNNYMSLFGCDNIGTGMYASYYWPTYAFMIRNESWKYQFNFPTCQRCDAYTSSPDPALYDTRVVMTIGETEATWHEYGSDTIYHSTNDNRATFAPVDFDRPQYPVPTLGLFGVHRADGTNTPSWDDPADARIYSFTIREEDSDIHKFIPVIKTTNGTSVTGMYDIINDNFIQYDQTMINTLPSPTNTDVTSNDVRIVINNGHYTITGTADGDVEQTFSLNQNIVVPESVGMGGHCSVVMKNNVATSTNIEIIFGYYDGSSSTDIKSYKELSQYFVDQNMYDIRNSTINYIKIKIKNGETVNLEISPMLYNSPGNQIPSGTIAFVPYGYPTIQTRQFTYKTKPHTSLNSRIIVAAGGGGGQFWNARPSKYSECASGGGAFGGAPYSDNGFNMNRYPTQIWGAHFGRGQDALAKHDWGVGSGGAEGEAGGGGGWFGGYANIGLSDGSYTSACGGGGSSYILTSTSYKPSGYMNGYTMSNYYFTNTFMEAGRSTAGKAIIARKTTQLLTGDTIISVCTGRMEKVTLGTGVYRLECNGGWGSSRYVGYESKGGYAAGTLTLDTETDLFMNTGGTPAMAVKTSDLPGEYWNSRYSTTTYNGGNCQNQNSFEGCCTASGGGSDIRLIRPELVFIHKSIPDEYTEVEYLENPTGNRGYVNTQYTHKSTTIVECNCHIYQNTYSSYQTILGSRKDYENGRLVVFSRYGDYDIPAFACDTGDTTGSGLLYDQDIKIVINGTNMSWYDSSDEFVGEINASVSAQHDGHYPLYLFSNCTNGNSIDPSYCRIMSLILIENDEYVRYFIPCKRNLDDVIGMYDLITDTFIPQDIVSGYSGLVLGPAVSTKTVIDVYQMINVTESTLSRIIVAGGGGGVGGGTNTYGGWGGGSTGGTYEGSNQLYGDNPGPGTQTESPHTYDSRIWGDFGYGGLGLFINSGFGGSGGGGWYGGGGTIPDGSGDDDKPGSGGSGYVLTTSSYKPSGYIPDSRYYLTDTSLTLGGTTEPAGVTSTKIRVIEMISTRILIEDSMGIKCYDQDNEEWVLAGVSTITTETLSQYGSTTIPNDNGLLKPFTVYINDENNLYDGISLEVVPNTITLSTTIQAPNPIETASLDIDTDNTLTYTISHSMSEDAGYYDITCMFDMLDVPTSRYNVYNIFTTSTLSSDVSIYPPIRPYKHLDHVDLMKVGESGTIPNKYNDYTDSTLEDGTTITDIYYTNTIEYNRELYTLMAVQDGVIRLIKYTLATKTYSVIFEISNTLLGFDTYVNGDVIAVQLGGFVIDTDYVYISQRYGSKMVKIDLSDTTNIILINPTNDITCRGKLLWISDYEFAIPTITGFNIFNTKTQEISSNTAHTTFTGYDWIATEKYFITGCVTGNTLLVYDRTNDEYTTITTGGTDYQTLCRDDDYVYIGQKVTSASPIVEIHDIDTLDLVRIISLPATNVSPQTLDVANGVLYYTFADSYDINLCKIISAGQDDFRSIRSQYLMKQQSYDTYTTSDWQYSPCVFRSYYFMPNFRLLTINFTDAAKYSLGYKYNRNIYQTILQYESSFDYDSTFMTFTEGYLNIHTGIKTLEFGTYSGTIKYCTNNIDYRKLIRITFNERS